MTNTAVVTYRPPTGIQWTAAVSGRSLSLMENFDTGKFPGGCVAPNAATHTITYSLRCSQEPLRAVINPATPEEFVTETPIQAPSCDTHTL